jgi:nucleoside-diphosphate-sugar epimerase
MSRTEKSDATILGLGATPVRCNLDDISARQLQDCEIVIHCAAHVGDWGTREQYWSANVDGTRRLLDAAKKAGIKRFILISTEAALFHGQDLNCVNEDYPVSTDTPFLYSETKGIAEKLVLEANNHDQNFMTMAVRPRLVWGPGDTTILPKIADKVEKGQFMWIDHGSHLTSTTYVDNLTYALELMLTRGNGGQAYFITDDEVLTLKEFLTRLLATQHVDLPEKSIPHWLAELAAMATESAWRLFKIEKAPPLTRLAIAMMSHHCTINIDKAKSELGYQPQFSISQGLHKMSTSAHIS